MIFNTAVIVCAVCLFIYSLMFALAKGTFECNSQFKGTLIHIDNYVLLFHRRVHRLQLAQMASQMGGFPFVNYKSWSIEMFFSRTTFKKFFFSLFLHKASCSCVCIAYTWNVLTEYFVHIISRAFALSLKAADRSIENTFNVQLTKPPNDAGMWHCSMSLSSTTLTFQFYACGNRLPLPTRAPLCSFGGSRTLKSHTNVVRHVENHSAHARSSPTSRKHRSIYIATAVMMNATVAIQDYFSAPSLVLQLVLILSCILWTR